MKELKLDIAASLWMLPCKEDDLPQRNFLKNISLFGIGRAIMQLEKENAIIYKGDVIHIKRSWAKKNLQEYELDFRTDRQKQFDGMTEFAKQFYKSTK